MQPQAWWENAKEAVAKVPGARCYVSGWEQVYLCIKWAAGTNDDIIAAFEDWVRKSRPEKYPPPRGRGSRKKVIEAPLSQLTTMRLLAAYPYDKAAALAGRRGISFEEQSNALNARQEVKQKMQRIFRGV